MNDECVLRCEENYEYRTEDDEYVCKAKECKDRTPFTNGSCSLKEDFATEGNDVGCYLLRGNEEEMWICVSEGECPNGYLEFFFFFFNIIHKFFYFF
jgi:hypothetical protein